MAKFTPQQAADVAAIQQVINEWGDQLDVDSGTTIRNAGILTEDVRYFVAGEWREGIDAVAQFYHDRMARLTAAGGAPVMRHIHSNYRVDFVAEDHAKVGFLLLFFAAPGEPPFKTCDPLAQADVTMECRRDASGDWKISLFDSVQKFVRG